MKTFKKILLFFIFFTALNSCLVDDETDYDLNDKGPNLAGFAVERTSFSFVSDGNEYDFTLQVKVAGPTANNLKNPVTLRIAADPSSTAIEGTHFRIDEPTVTLQPGENYLGTFPITILTQGIMAPLEAAPKLVLAVTDASGEPTVLNNGKKIEITLNYGCFSNLAGTYTLTIERISTTGAASTIVRNDEVITQTGVGTYRTTYVGHWTPEGLAPGTPGFTFTDVCNELFVEEQNLADYWANIVTGTAVGSVNPATGNLYIEYSVCYDGACNFYKCTYVKQP